jgi:hypothetical protein
MFHRNVGIFFPNHTYEILLFIFTAVRILNLTSLPSYGTVLISYTNVISDVAHSGGKADINDVSDVASLRVFKLLVVIAVMYTYFSLSCFDIVVCRPVAR